MILFKRAAGAVSVLFTLAMLFGPAGAHARRQVAAAPGSADPRCGADKNQSTLKAVLKVEGGRLAVDKKLSQGGFTPSDRFKCLAGFEGGPKQRRVESHLLDNLDKALRSLPRFYLLPLLDKEQEELLTSLPADERVELIGTMPLDTTGAKAAELKKKYFPYMTGALQQTVLGDLTPAERRDFFAYLPDEEQEKVLQGVSEAEREQLLAKKKEREERRDKNLDDPPRMTPPANEKQRKAVSGYPGADKKAVGTWAGFLKVYNDWNDSRAVTDEQKREGVPHVALKSYLSQLLGGRVLINTAIVSFNPQGLEIDEADDARGRISLHVADPIGDLTKTGDYKIVVPEPAGDVPGAAFITPSDKRVVKILSPLKGQLWECKRLEAYINDYFIRGRSGYERTAEATNPLEVCKQEPFDEPKVIRIPYVPHVGRIEFLGHMEEKDFRVALRELLTDAELRAYRRNPKLMTKCEGTPAGQAGKNAGAGGGGGAQPSATPEERQPEVECVQLKYQDLRGGADKLPYLNLINWRLQAAGLKDSGFASTVEAYDPSPPKAEGEDEAADEDEGDEREKNVPLFVKIIVVKSDAGNESLIKNIDKEHAKETPPEGDAAAPTPSPEATPGGTPPPGAAASGTTAPAEQPRPQKKAGAGNKKGKAPVSKPRNNFIGGELVYRPGQGVRAYGLYSRKLSGKDDFRVRLGGDAGVLVSGEYESQDLFRNSFYHTFPFSVRGFSDTLAKRILNGVRLDERRTGGSFRISTDWKTQPTRLNFFMEAKRETVQLERGEAVDLKQNLTTLSFGGMYAGATEGVINTAWQVEPVLRLGPGLGGQPGFAVLSVSGLLHFYLPGDRDLIFDGRTDAASDRTPLFEQPSFGSEETVRGFRADDAIGLRQWALRTEVQVPVPGTSPDAEGVARIIRTLKLAGFLDVGGIYRTTGSAPGVRLGPGAGLRVDYGGAKLGLSWAYGIGDAASTGRGRGRFYFSVSREIPRRIR
ncbi:MAG TPA: BamA/TamA family outer membrane protein [Pyrinomonadaceae bacterium]|jgi:hypothetical protein